jgi:signal transduction histidine kinase/FixJ family two-component response regulator
MSANSARARLPFPTRFGLQWQVRLLLVVALGMVLGATFWTQRLQRQLSASAHRAVDLDANQSSLASEIVRQVLLTINLENRFGLVWDTPALRRKTLDEYRTAQARLESLLGQLATAPLSKREQREVDCWCQAVRRHGESFVDFAQDVEAGRLTSHEALLDNIDRKDRHLHALLQAVECFSGARMAAIHAEGREIKQLLAVTQQWLVGRAILSFVIVGVAWWWFSRHVITRIKRLTRTVAQFGDGHLQVRAPVTIRDELGVLNHQFNAMASEIQRSLDRLNQEIAQHKRTTAELKKAQEAAQSASLAKSEFLANVSHEIRTPMTAILGFTDILLGNVAHPESVEAAKTIQRNGAFLLEIIDDILDLSKIEAGKLELEQVACSPRQILADVLALMRVRADAKGLGLEVAYEGPLPATVVTDPTRLRQILVNLVGNAIKFTETGSVRVVVQLIEGGRGQPMLRFDVIDTGIGINGDRVAKLFTPFTQGDSSMHRRYGGSGLGLTISKRLAEMLGGTITVASQPGVGSTFSATITPGSLDHMPLLAEVEHARETPASATVPPRTPTRLHGRVLLVEDGPDNQRLISFLLKKAGAEVTLAENGKVALEKALSVFPRWRRRHTDQLEEFDVILMDMQMPVMDGYEATRRLRSAGYRGPIIALTAHAMTDDRQKCLDAGCDDYITKPVNREQLLTVLAASLARLEAAADDHDEGAGEDSLELASEWDS